MPPNDVIYPVWAWYQWEGVRKRPDMRTHVVLNNGYLPLYDKDDIEYPSEDEN